MEKNDDDERLSFISRALTVCSGPVLSVLHPYPPKAGFRPHFSDEKMEAQRDQVICPRGAG